MCVIIDKSPGFELPFPMLLSAASRNPDGWGIIKTDGTGAQEVRKGLTTPGYAADAVARALEDCKDGRALIHFRYRTQGDRGIDNVHPFQVLNKKDDGTDLYLMHNGTLTEFSPWGKDDPASDTKAFVDEIVRPLSLLVAQSNGPDLVIDDPFFRTILDKYASGHSKFSLIDSKGNVLHINKKMGKDFEWGWASNDYSLYSSGTVKPEHWKEAGREPPQKPVVVTKVPEPRFPSSSTTTHGGFTPLSERAITKNAAVARLVANNTNTKDTIKDYEPQSRVDLCGVLDITGLSDLHCLDEKQWRTIVTEHPDCAVLALLEFSYDHYKRSEEGCS